VPSSESVRPAGDELRGQLDRIFSFDVSSGRSYEELIEALVTMAPAEQDFALHWATVAARTHLEIAYLAILLLPQVLRRLSTRQAEAWVVAALEAFDRTGLRAAVLRLRDVEGFARGILGQSVALESVEARLVRFLQGLSGRSLRVMAAATAWTDTETVYLPPAMEAASREAGTERYKAMAALLWAQARHGTFKVDLDAALAAFYDRTVALAWLAQLEALRLTARLGRDLPGMRSELDALLQGLPPVLDSAHTPLAAPAAGVADSLAWLRARPELLAAAPPALPWLGELRPEEAQRARGARIRQQAEVLRLSVADLVAALQDERESHDVAVEVDEEGLETRVIVNGQELALPPEGMAAAQSLIQDLGEIPPELLVPAGPGDWNPNGKSGDGRGTSMETRADLLLDEWDYRRQAYRHGWCHVYLQTVGGTDTAYVPAVRARYAPLVRQLRRRFEAMRGEDRVLRRQADGPEVDMDALVTAIADRRGGAEPGTRLFCRRQRDERSLAAAFLVDMSGSTEGWINDAEREALVMLCEALEMLDDRYAIWGFSGWTRTRCDLYRIKEFDEPYDAAVQARIAAIKPRDYTRMGPPIRYLTRRLLAEPAKHRLLISLSDGRPDDFGDDYRSQYGIEDTRRALLEARQAGVRSFCVTIDRNGADYLKHMYGPAAFTVLDDVKKLPLRIADIYRKLTF
jgi:nitric oxide reductase NorD protein